MFISLQKSSEERTANKLKRKGQVGLHDRTIAIDNGKSSSTKSKQDNNISMRKRPELPVNIILMQNKLQVWLNFIIK